MYSFLKTVLKCDTGTQSVDKIIAWGTDWPSLGYAPVLEVGVCGKDLWVVPLPAEGGGVRWRHVRCETSRRLDFRIKS